MASTGHPGGGSPEKWGGNDKPYRHPFDVYWFGFYMDPLGDHQLDLCNPTGWISEFARWIKKRDLHFGDLYPHRFIIWKKDPSTSRRVDLSRREFFAVQKQFEFLINKYEFRFGGSLAYSRTVPGHPTESFPELYWSNRVYSGDSIGRPYRHRLPVQTQKSRSNPKP